MARDRFLDNLRLASRLLARPRAGVVPSNATGARSATVTSDSALWLTPKAVADFDVADFADLPLTERVRLEGDVASFLSVANSVPPGTPATANQRTKARKSLEGVIRTVREALLAAWLGAQRAMMGDAAAAAEGEGWYVERDEKVVTESLLGQYKAPRLTIRTDTKGVVLEPIAFFGSGRRGVVDLILLPAYETKCLVTFQDGRWELISPNGRMHRRPFSASAFVNAITHLRTA